MKLTPWFPSHVKPVHVGIYKTRVGHWDSEFFSYWNGRQWSIGYPSMKTAMMNKRTTAAHQSKTWQGIAK